MPATTKDELLFYAEDAIRKNKYYYDSILNDPSYKNFQPEIKALRIKLFNEIKKQNENEVLYLYSQFKLKHLFELGKSQRLPSNTKDMIQNIESNMNLIDQRMKNNTYSDYVDNIELMRDMKKWLEIIKNNLNEFKANLEASLAHLKNQSQNSEKNLHLSKRKALMDKINASLLLLLSIPGICLTAISFLDSDFMGENIHVVTIIWTLSLAVLILYNNYKDDKYINKSENIGWLTFIFSFTLGILFASIISFVIMVVYLISLSIIDFFSEYTADLLDHIVSTIMLVLPLIFSFKLLYVSLHESNTKRVQESYNKIAEQINDIELFLKNLPTVLN